MDSFCSYILFLLFCRFQRGQESECVRSGCTLHESSRALYAVNTAAYLSGWYSKSSQTWPDSTPLRN